jgi:hypothetical protein
MGVQLINTNKICFSIATLIGMMEATCISTNFKKPCFALTLQPAFFKDLFKITIVLESKVGQECCPFLVPNLSVLSGIFQKKGQLLDCSMIIRQNHKEITFNCSSMAKPSHIRQFEISDRFYTLSEILIWQHCNFFIARVSQDITTHTFRLDL